MDISIYCICDENKHNEIIVDNLKEETKQINKYNVYRKTFLNKNDKKIKEKITCNICRGSYTYFNKSSHNNTKKHKSFLLSS